jgi:hypothetical protein
MNGRLGNAAIIGLWSGLAFGTAPWNRASAQELVPPWNPTPGMFGVSAGGYGTDSEIMRRVGIGAEYYPAVPVGLTAAIG